MNTRWLSVLCVLWLAAYGQPVAAKTLTIYTSPTPVLSDASGSPDNPGFAVELVQGIISTAGFEHRLINQPGARTLRDTQHKALALSGLIARTPEREDAFYWITPVLENQVVLYALKNSILTSTAPGSTKDFDNIAVVRNDFRARRARSLNPASVVELNNWKQAVSAVLKGRVQSVLYSPAGLSSQCQQHQLACEELVPVAQLPSYYLYLAMAKVPKNAALLPVLKQAAQDYKESPAYQQLMYRAKVAFAQHGVTSVISDKLLTLGNVQIPVQGMPNLWVLADQLPYFVQSQGNKQLSGYTVELVRQILQHAGVEAPILLTPWPRILREMQFKPNVMTVAMARTPQREEQYHWITPVTRTQHALFGLASSHTPVIPELNKVPKQALVAVREGDFRAAALRELGIAVRTYSSWEEAVQAVIDQQADYVYSSRPRLAVLCKTNSDLCNRLQLKVPATIVTTYIALSKNNSDPALVARLTQAARQVKQSEEFQQHAARWRKQMTLLHNVPVHMEQGVVNLWPSKDTE
ncbi:transporter substrate-binding domain-containing protein [Salinimonas marina]|uniref:Transporter substrate-binding domain-containing protein n=1 Tax=Salinimonas marina TaxID=2785918 RepID=A0A7S9HD39_9ALTE|nr:transporter substrate-binding domain-containing protein [Salinimonas marina]QPG05916.1 transporter substrate-binding domain-containing protein [Salinimonas marina]